MLVVVGLTLLASLPAGAVAGASIPVETATGVLGGIAAFYIILTVALAVCIFCLLCGKGRAKVVPEKLSRSLSRRKYKFDQSQAFELKGRNPSHGGTGETRVDIKPPPPLSTQRLTFHHAPPSPLTTHRHTKDAHTEEVDLALGGLDLPDYMYSTQKSSGSSSYDDVFDDPMGNEQPSPLPTREEIKKKAIKLRGNKGRTPSTKPLLNGSESSEGPPTPMEETSTWIPYGNTQPIDTRDTIKNPSYEHGHKPIVDEFDASVYASHSLRQHDATAAQLQPEEHGSKGHVRESPKPYPMVSNQHDGPTTQPKEHDSPDKYVRERPKPSPKKISSSAVETMIDVPVPGAVNQSPLHIPNPDRERQMSPFQIPYPDRERNQSPLHIPNPDRERQMSPFQIPYPDRERNQSPLHIPNSDRGRSQSPLHGDKNVQREETLL